MYVRVSNFLESLEIIFNTQFGFQRNKSTTLEILDVYAKLVYEVVFSLISKIRLLWYQEYCPGLVSLLSQRQKSESFRLG